MLAWLLESSAIAAVLALVAALAGRSRRVGPSTMHALWLLVVVRLMIPPLVHWPAIGDRPAQGPAEAGGSEILAPAGVAGSEVEEVPTVIAFEEVPAIDAESIVPAPIEVLSFKKESKVERPDFAPWLLSLWAIGSASWVVNLASQVARFRRRLVDSAEAPARIGSMLKEVGLSLGVRPPRALVVEDLDSPILWCLGAPMLLLPGKLVASLDADAWRGILAHELAHVRRGDPWVGRFLMLAGALLWWHPLFRWARARVEAEAELACDAWVVAVRPEGRRRYASALVDVCESFSTGRVPAPALGVGGSPGKLLERRLIMILRERVSPRSSLSGLVALGLLGALSLPSWTRAQDEPEKKVVIITRDEPKADPEPKPEGAAKSERKIVVNKVKDGEASFQVDVEVDGKKVNLEGLKALPGQLMTSVNANGIFDSDEIVAKVKEALEKANVDEATRAAVLGKLRALPNVATTRFAVPLTPSALSQAEAQVQMARAQLAAAEARLKAEAAKLSGQARKMEAQAGNIRITRAPFDPTAPKATTSSRGLGIARSWDAFGNPNPDSDLEKRMKTLESKVDALLDELKALRKEKSEKTEGAEVPSGRGR